MLKLGTCTFAQAIANFYYFKILNRNTERIDREETVTRNT